MSNDGSLGVHTDVFDLESQSGVAHLLASIRASEMSAEQKNELRDLVFLYVNGGRDQSVRISLEQKITAAAVTPLTKTVLEKEAVVTLPFGTSRPAPSFSFSPASATQAEPVAESPKEKEMVVPPVPPPPESVPVSMDSMSDSVSSPPLVEEVGPIVAPVEEVKSQAPDPTPPVPPPIEQESPSTAQPSAPYDPEANLRRIREIKALVNEKVGNPVNLIDINNDIGREYMTALLEAMKKINGGASSASAMQRLETAFASVEQVIGEHQSVSDQEKSATEPSGLAVESEEVSIVTEPSAGPVQQSASKPIPASVPQPVASITEPDMVPTAETEVAEKSEKETESVMPLVFVVEKKPEPDLATMPESVITPETEPSVEEKPITNSSATAILSVPPAPQVEEMVTPPSPKNEPLEVVEEQVKNYVPKSQMSDIPAGLPIGEVQIKSQEKPGEVIESRLSDSVEKSLEDKKPLPPVANVRKPRPILQSTLEAHGEPEEIEEELRSENLPPVRQPSLVPKPPTAPPPEASLVESSWGPKTDTVMPDARRTAADTKIASLADSTPKLKTPADLPKPSSLETSSVPGDPLFTKEVDAGLEQLLSEWPIFKKSGFFGTGPKGREHPLYKKISGLQIPLLLAGRFEGATQEIKQSITDYMNGWRYEQGIIYHQGETFEHYLRRVIRHIVDLQR